VRTFEDERTLPATFEDLSPKVPSAVLHVVMKPCGQGDAEAEPGPQQVSFLRRGTIAFQLPSKSVPALITWKQQATRVGQYDFLPARSQFGKFLIRNSHLLDFDRFRPRRSPSYACLPLRNWRARLADLFLAHPRRDGSRARRRGWAYFWAYRAKFESGKNCFGIRALRNERSQRQSADEIGR
jgi:hypothetical protein